MPRLLEGMTAAKEPFAMSIVFKNPPIENPDPRRLAAQLARLARHERRRRREAVSA